MTLNSPNTPASLRAHADELDRYAAETAARARDYREVAARLEAELTANAGNTPAHGSPIEQQAQAAVNGGQDAPEKPS